MVIAELVIKKGLPLETGLTNAALGNRVYDLYVKHGGKACERTVRDDIRELFGEPVGRMPEQLVELFPGARGPFLVQRRGANTYSVLAIADDKLRTRLLRRVHALIEQFARLTRTRVNAITTGRSAPPFASRGSLTANELNRSVSRALERAIGDAEGRRNNVGHRLAWRCRYLGLDQSEVDQVMEQYQEEVCGLGSHPYTRREAMATLRSVFRRGPLSA